MQEKVDYESLNFNLTQLIYKINDYVLGVRTDCGSLAYQLNTMGLQSTATSVIDSSFSNMYNYLSAGYEYFIELVKWVNTNVMENYKLTDSFIQNVFNALEGGIVSGGYKKPHPGDGPEPSYTPEGAEWVDYVGNYGKAAEK